MSVRHRIDGHTSLLALVVAALLAVPAIAGAASPQAKLTASDGTAGDVFGRSTAVSGDTAVVGAVLDNVGANGDQGSAYVFTSSGSTWSEQAKLTASDGAGFDFFGFSVAVSGDTAVVGAPFDEVGANAMQGSAYVFTRSGSTWSEQAKLTASDGAAGDVFGGSVGVSGDTVVVGANQNNAHGSAYVFTRSGSTWSEQTKLTASDGAGGDLFGFSVAVSDDVAVVGAVSGDVGANAIQGSAYVFTRSGSTWSEQAKLTASDGAVGDAFGTSVAVSDETAVVGARVDRVGANANQGSAYVFTRSGSTWSEQAKLTASDGAAFDSFGVSVAVSGDVAVVGARFDDLGTNGAQGSAYVFTRGASTWSEQAKLTASDGAAFDDFGFSVAVSGDVAVVGAPFDDDFGDTSGSAYAFGLVLDSDGDGIPDASDPDTVAEIIGTLDPGDFSAPGHETSIRSHLGNAEAQILAGNIEEAIRQLENLQRHVDGCVTAGVADRDDWIVPCDAQLTVWQEIEDMIAALSA